MNPVILQKEKSINLRIILVPFALIAIYFMFIPIVLLDISVFIYQQIYFTALQIPKINRADYIVIDRWKLRKLNLWQKLNCVYCGYANGVSSYFQAIVNQTEIYSCAIKHSTAKKGNEHQKNFYNYNDFK